MSEIDLQRTIMDMLQSAGFEVYRMPLEGIRSRGAGGRRKNPLKGFPDLFGNIRGTDKMFAIEVKTHRGRISSDQTLWLKKLQDWGWIAFVARDGYTAVEKLNEYRRNHISR